ncbi:MAG: transglycosylase SLT domain-containing protein [Patescibacteria group bacterium]
MNTYTHALTLTRAGIMTRGKYLTKKRRIKRFMYKTYTILAAIMIAAGTIGAYGLITERAIEKMDTAHISVPQRQKSKGYAYNERVPVEVVKQEIRETAKQYGVNEVKALKIAECESGFDNLRLNHQGSTALGVYQFLIGTWMNTDSFKIHRKARTDYKANIEEGIKAMARGEARQKWPHCAKVAGF